MSKEKLLSFLVVKYQDVATFLDLATYSGFLNLLGPGNFIVAFWLMTYLSVVNLMCLFPPLPP
jgi:hypothetical protein